METNKFFVKELSLTEQTEINGGFLGALLGFIAVMGAVVYMYDVAVPQIVKGFKEGYQSTQN